MYWKKIFAAALMMISVDVFGQDAWDLQKCIDYAIKHNIQISQQELTERIAKNNYLQSKLAVLPTLNGNASLSRNFGRSIDYTTFQYVDLSYTSNSYSVTSNFNLFNGLKDVNTIRQNQMLLQSSHFQTEATKNNVLLSITQAYLAILQAKESLKSLQEQVNVSISQVNQAKQLFDAGTVAEGNLIKAQAQLSTDSFNLISAQNGLLYNLVNLAVSLNVEAQGFDVATPPIPDDLPMMSAQDAATVYETAVQTQPQISSAKYSYLASLKSVSMAKSYQSPTLTLFSGLSARYSNVPALGVKSHVDNYPTQLKNTFGQYVGLNVDVAILNGWQVRTNIQNAKVRALQSELNLSQAKLQLKQDVYRAYTDAKSALERYRAAQNNVAALKIAYDYAQNLFDLGASNAVDYSTAKSNLAVGQVNMINAKYDYLFKLKVLDFYQGKPIKL